MAQAPIILRSQPGIKRDGTKFDGEFYTDGQWVRFQRGLPRKIGGFRAVQKYLTEVSRGFTSYTQQSKTYCHSGGASKLERFTLDSTMNGSAILDRSPISEYATGTITLTGGSSGTIDAVTVNGESILSNPVEYFGSLEITATILADSIVSSNYTAVAVGAVVTITASVGGSAPNGYVVVATATDITVETTNMSGGTDDGEFSDDDNMWMFDYQFDSSTSQNYLLAHVSPNLSCQCNDVNGKIFFGSVTGEERLVGVPIPPDANCSGGIVSLHPYLMYYGTDGIVGWSKPGEPTDLISFEDGAGLARVWGQKIIKGLPLRGSAPSGIFWAWDAVVRATFTGGATVWQFDVITSDSSILSSNCVVDYDGVFYWAGVDRFLMFNGVVREVPNTMNLNWFFDGLNDAQRSKVFAFKVTRFGEIWWCYPKGDATECTHAVIYNVRENTWYDTELPLGGRSAGQFNNQFSAPILTSAVLSDPLKGAVPADKINNSAVTNGIINAATSGGADAVIFNEVFNGRKLGDINGDGTVNVFDGLQYGRYSNHVEAYSPSAGIGLYIESVFRPILLSDPVKYKKYLDLYTVNEKESVWLHEQGVDEVDGQTINSVSSWFETADMSALVKGDNSTVRITRIEPDFIQSGPMTVRVTGRANARAPEVLGAVVEFPETASTSQEQTVTMKDQRRELRVRFESNAVGGDYQMGQIIGHLGAGDKTMLS